VRCTGEGTIVPSAGPYADYLRPVVDALIELCCRQPNPDLKIRGLEVLWDSTGARKIKYDHRGAAHASPDDSLQKIVTPIPLYREIYMDIGDLNLVFLNHQSGCRVIFYHNLIWIKQLRKRGSGY
jgi:hypothetical protein